MARPGPARVVCNKPAILAARQAIFLMVDGAGTGSMTTPDVRDYVSRGGDKLSAALDRFGRGVKGLVCADLGSHVGGFVDCLLRRGATRVYAVDTCYGTLAWKLRRDPRVVPLERTNAIHVELVEPVDLVTIDVGWTPQARILPNVARLIETPPERKRATSGADDPPGVTGGSSDGTAGCVVTLIKPHYEAPKQLLVKGVLPDDCVDNVVRGVLARIASSGWSVNETFESPLRGHAGNREVFALLTPARSVASREFQPHG